MKNVIDTRRHIMNKASISTKLISTLIILTFIFTSNVYSLERKDTLRKPIGSDALTRAAKAVEASSGVQEKLIRSIQSDNLEEAYRLLAEHKTLAEQSNLDELFKRLDYERKKFPNTWVDFWPRLASQYLDVIRLFIEKNSRLATASNLSKVLPFLYDIYNVRDLDLMSNQLYLDARVVSLIRYFASINPGALSVRNKEIAERQKDKAYHLLAMHKGGDHYRLCIKDINTVLRMFDKADAPMLQRFALASNSGAQSDAKFRGEFSAFLQLDYRVSESIFKARSVAIAKEFSNQSNFNVLYAALDRILHGGEDEGEHGDGGKILYLMKLFIDENSELATEANLKSLLPHLYGKVICHSVGGNMTSYYMTNRILDILRAFIRQNSSSLSEDDRRGILKSSKEVIEASSSRPPFYYYYPDYVRNIAANILKEFAPSPTAKPGPSLASGETIQQEALQEVTALISKAIVSGRSADGQVNSRIYRDNGKYIDRVFVRLYDGGGSHKFTILVTVGEALRASLKLDEIKIDIINKGINAKVETVTLKEDDVAKGLWHGEATIAVRGNRANSNDEYGFNITGPSLASNSGMAALFDEMLQDEREGWGPEDTLAIFGGERPRAINEGL